ncbi:MAG: gliding motility-associated C-terminal domain-containing protein [Flavobacteriales bacterium]|nr:gliding motility-associated C-terminal domain-containing protein [Flavobacteriales bacterium]
MKRLILIISLLIQGMGSVFAQTDNYGTEFWTAFMSNFSSSTLRLFIAAKDTAEVDITVPLMGYATKITVPKDSVVIVTIPNTVGQISSSEVVEKTGIHILSDYPIAVTSMNLQPATTDATVVFPLKNVPNGTKYITGHPGKVSNMAGNQFMLVSPEDNVQLEIIPTAKTLQNNPAFQPINITLDAGEVYQVRGAPGNILDGSSIKVLNNKRIIVYTGDKCSAFPCGACDHQVEQVFPVRLLDTAYYILPHFGHTKGYTAKVVSIDTTLMVKVNGKMYRIGSRDSALTLDVPTEDSVLHISADRKFECFQFMKGPTCNGYITPGWGDPAILQLLSSKYMGNLSTFNTVNSTNIRDHFVSILVYTSAINDVFLDGVRIPSSEFIEVTDNKKFSYAKIKITLGVHRISCNYGHLAYCYGIGSYESYLYTAGFSLPNFQIDIKDSVLSYQCIDTSVTMQFKAQLDGAIRSYKWDFGDGTTDSVQTVTHKYPVGKEFTIKLWAVGFNNKTDSVIKKYTFNWPEFNPVFDQLICDQTFKFEELNPFFTNFLWHDNSTKNSYISSKSEKIKVYATDTSGYCKFVDSAVVGKVGVYTKIKVDTLSNCHLNNLYRFSDSSYIVNDSILYKAWIFPGGVTLYDTSNFLFHFRQPGKYKVYLDIYPKNANCKARYEIPININWNTDIGAYTDKDEYCDGETAIIKDSSYSCCQKVKKYYWLLEDGSIDSTDTGPKMKLRVKFDTVSKKPYKNYYYITETEQGCRDTFKSGMIVMPAADSEFDFGPDTMKCMVLSRWTFTHTVDESIVGKYEHLWDFGNGLTGNQSQYKNIRYLDTGWHTIKLLTINYLGCRDSTYKKVRAIPNPIPVFSISDSVQCLSGNAFNFKPLITDVGYTYKWYLNNKFYDSRQNPKSYTADSSGKFTVKLVASSEHAGCFDDSLSKIFEVLKSPVADFEIVSDTQCLKDNMIDLLQRSVSFNGSLKYYWNYLNKIDSVKIPARFSYPDIGLKSISLRVVDSMGCADSIGKKLFVAPMPKAEIYVNDSVQCYGVNSFKFTQSSSAIPHNTTWKQNGKPIGTEDSVSLYDLKNIGTGKIGLKISTQNGCTDSTEKTFEVLPPPKASFLIDKDTQCFENHNISLQNNSSTPKDFVLKYKYESTEGIMATTSDIVDFKFNSDGRKDITLTIESGEGCKDTFMSWVYLSKSPEGYFIPDSVCIGESIRFEAFQSSGIFPVQKWHWNFGDGISSILNPEDHIYLAYGTYPVTLSFEDALGCKGSYTDYALIYPKPDPEFKINILSFDDVNTLIRLKPKYAGKGTFTWTFPDGTIQKGDSLITKVDRFFKNRIYLNVLNQYGCFDSSSEFLFVFPPLENLYIENAFTPNGDLLNDVFRPIKFDGTHSYSLQVFNRWGELVFQSQDPLHGWDGTYNGQPVQDDAYIYKLNFVYEDGIRYNLKGTVTIVR